MTSRTMRMDWAMQLACIVAGVGLTVPRAVYAWRNRRQSPRCAQCGQPVEMEDQMFLYRDLVFHRECCGLQT